MKSGLWIAGLIAAAGMSGSAWAASSADGQTPSARAAHAAMEQWAPGSIVQASARTPMSDAFGTLLEGMATEWMDTADARFFNYIKSSVDPLVQADGSMPSLKPEEHPLHVALLGRQLILLYGVTQDQRYAKAAALIYQKLVDQARSSTGGSAQERGGQTVVNESYLAGPFYAEYAATFQQPDVFNDAVRAFDRAEKPAQDADRIGLRMAALVDTLEYLPRENAARTQLIKELERDAATVARFQEVTSELWLQAIDQSRIKENRIDISASCMIVYALAKGIREGNLPERSLAHAERAYKSILEKKTSGDDPVEVGAFLLASTEMEHAQQAKLGRGDTVLMDGWFNSQTRLDAFGQRVSFHYKWYDQSNDGYSLLGRILRNYGAKTETTYTAPTTSSLHNAQAYIIASPDTVAKNPHPHFVEPEEAAQIAEWVKDGGVLVLLANDPANTDLEHFNLIAEKFGIHFNSVLRKHVIGNAYETGKLVVPGGGPIFHDPHVLFMKDVCNITVASPAVSAFQDDEGILMATAKYGKGTVFATVDPWLYNEYTDGRKPGAEYDNFAAGNELFRWVLEQVPHTH